MTSAIQTARAHIAHIAQILFHRRLLDISGGNISVRVGEQVCLSPAYAGSQRHWDLAPDDVLVVDLASGDILEGAGKLSRESNVHLGLHRAFGEHGTAVIHAHPQNVMVFAAMNKPMFPVVEACLKFGEIKLIHYAPAHSTHLAENVVGAIRGQEGRIQKHAAGVIAPWHGLFLMGKDLDAAADAVERLDTNAYCILMAGRMPDTSAYLEVERTQLQAAAQQAGKAL
jgi:L-fuculose-phosphate aldolase